MSESGKEIFNVEASVIDTLNESIHEQNDRFDEAADSISNVRLREIVHVDVADEQIDTFQVLLEKSLKQPYSSIGERALSLSKALKNAEDESAVLDAANLQRVALLEQEIAIAERLAPRKTDEIKELEAAEKQRIETNIKKQLIERIKTELEDVEELITEYGKPWPIPKAISGADRTLYLELVCEEADRIDSELVSEDLIPVTPDERMHQVDLAEKAQKSVSVRDAKHFISYYLSERAGTVVSVEELARFLYIANVEDHRTNVTTLLGPKIQGKKVQSHLLEEHGLLLQYGWRILKDANGLQRKKTRIYRAVPTIDNGNVQLQYERPFVEGSKVLDQFEELVIQTSSLEGDEEAEIVIESDAVAEAENGEKQQEWENELRDAVNEAIDRLIESNLFYDDVMRGTTIRSLSSTRVLGTETNRNRMRDAGLMRVGEAKQDQMTRKQRVIGSLLNSHISVLSRKSGVAKQKRSLEIIDFVIEERLAMQVQ